MTLRLLLGLGAATAALHATPADPVDLLLVADDAALQPLVQKLASPSVETRAAWTIWLGTLAGRHVALTRSEADPLNAIAATTLAVRLHPPHLIVTFGTARAQDPALHAGDVVVSEKFVAFDGMVSTETPPGGGSHPLTWQRLPHALMTPGEKERYGDSFPADPAATALALGLPSPSGGRVRPGVLGSAAQLNQEADRIAALRDQWHTDTADAESAFIAGCGELLSTPVVGFRVVDGTPAEAAAFALKFVEASK